MTVPAQPFASELRRIAALVRCGKGDYLAGAIREIPPTVRALEAHELWGKLPGPVQEELVAARKLCVTLRQLGKARAPGHLARWLLAGALDRTAGLCDVYESGPSSSR